MSEKIKPTALLIQFLATLAVAYLTTLTGFIYCWPSYTLATFTSTDTPLEEKMTPIQTYLLSSLTNVGALVITPFCGIIIDRLGRKYSAILFGLPFVISWSIILISKKIYLVLFAVFFAGIGGAGQVVSAIYISEIVQDSIRGGLTTSVVVGYFVGVLISYILGGQFSYHQDAGKAISFYRQMSVTSKEVQVEIDNIKRQLNTQIMPNHDGKEVFEELLVKTKGAHTPKNISPWKFLLKSPSSQRALFACLLLMTLTILMGSVVLQVYAEPLFKEAVPSMSANLCAVFLAIDFLISSLLSAFITDRVGRKNLTTCSSIASGICTLLLGLQLHVKFAPPWFTVFIVYMYCFVYTIGAATTPFVLSAEVFLPEVRGLCNSMIIGCMWLMNFLILIIYNPIVDAIGLGPVFYVFTVICFLGAAYSHLYLPETKGLPADAIQLLFYKQKRIPVDA